MGLVYLPTATWLFFGFHGFHVDKHASPTECLGRTKGHGLNI